MNNGQTTITNSTIAGNSSYASAGVRNDGSLTMTNSTVSGNVATKDVYDVIEGDGGIINSGAMTITDSTIAANITDADFGSAGVRSDSGLLTLSRTLIAGNAAPNATTAEIYVTAGSALNADDYNLFGDASKTSAQAFTGFIPGATDITATSDGTDPTALSNILDTTLADNGGPTQTHALVTGSPAIDAAGTDCVPTDQRGVVRPQGPACDIGAYEAEPAAAGPQVQCPGDINGDSIADIAVVTPDGNTWIKGLNGGLISQYTLTDINTVVDVETVPDINSNGSPELVALGTGSVQAEVWDTLTAAQLSLVPFDPSLTALDLELVDDQTGNSIPELANLAQGSVQVEVKDGLNGNTVNSVLFSNYIMPMDLEIYPDVNGNGAPELAVLGDNKDPAKGDKVEVRDLKTGNIVQNIWLGKGWQVLQQELLADHSGNGAVEVAVLRVKNNGDAVNVMVRDTKTRQRLGSIGFDRNYPPTHLLTISDVNGNGADEVVVFGQRFIGGNQKAQIKDSKTKALIKAVFFDKNFPGQDIATCADINGNGAEELVLLGKRDRDGKLKAIVKDAKTGALIGTVNF